MSATLELEDNRLCILCVNGVLKKSELEYIQTDFVRRILPDGPIKLLILLEDFNGWERGPDWGDTEFFFTYRDELEKVAIVGDPRWEAQTLAFTGAGLRKGPVKFFAEAGESAARAWIAE